MAESFALQPLTDPRMALAQQLLGQGTQDTPVRSWTQEAARALSGIVGASMANDYRQQQMQAYGDLAGLPSQQPQSQPGFLGRLFGSSQPQAQGVPIGGTPDASSSTPPASAPSPGTGGGASGPPQPSAALNPGSLASQFAYAQRMIAAGQQNGNLQLMQQGLALMTGLREKMAESELETSKALTLQHLQRNPDGSISPITGAGKSLGELAGAEEAGKNPALIARAAGTAWAENPALIARAGGTAAAENPALIARADQIAKAQAKYKITDVRPGGAAVPDSSILGITGASEPPVGNPVPQNAPAASPPAQGGSSGMLRQLPGGGVSIPNPSVVEPLIKSDTEEVHADREGALKGQQDQATVKMIQDFMPKVATGWSADSRLEAGRILQAMGTSPEKVKELTSIDPAAGQILQKKFVELSTAAARTLGAREPGSVIQMFQKAYPSLETTPQAIQLQTNALYMDRQRQNDLANAKTDYLNQSVNDYQSTGKYKGLKGFNESFNQTHPAEYYMHASEAMSGVPQAWQAIQDPQEQYNVISLIPKGSRFLGPDGQFHVRQ